MTIWETLIHPVRAGFVEVRAKWLPFFQGFAVHSSTSLGDAQGERVIRQKFPRLRDVAPRVAATAAATPAAATAGSAGELLRVVLSLVAVVVMILAVGWLTRRMQARVRPGGQRVRCLETLTVSVKERVLLLEVGDRQLLVGASPAGLRTLLVLDEALPTPKSPTSAPRMPGSFREVLAQWRKPR